ncbi:MAG TPA: ATP-binding protein [Paucimonas sp.]|nr:ATP-binding protein [Paucimonas sp.]
MAIFSKQKLEQIEKRTLPEKNRRSVLIVDDEECNRLVMSLLLEPHYRVLQAQDGLEALSILESMESRESLACIVSDQRMPKLTGVELFERARSLLPQAIRIIVTGFTDINTIVDSINKAEIYKFIVKPFDANEFQLTVQRAVESFELQLQLEEYQRELENKVQVRTRELEESRNKLLEAVQALQGRNEQLESLNRRLEQAHTQLLHSEKMASIGQLAAGVAHEINNPIGFVYSNFGTLEHYVADLLTVIDGYAPKDEASAFAVEALKKKVDYDYLKGDLSNLMMESKDGLLRVKKIVEDLKDFSRVDSQEWQIADIHHCIDSTLTIVGNELRHKAAIAKNFGVLPAVECLPSQLNQVFLNLLINAAQAIEGQGTITIQTGAEEEAVWVEIADTGKGIEPECLGRIFDPFFTTKPVGQGTGLGLSISYGIVKRHGGRISVDSVVGAGTRFRVHIPVRRSVAPQETSSDR